MFDSKRLRLVLGQFATGVTIVTTDGDGQPYGLTVNSFTSVSLDPPLVLICLDKRLSGLAAFKRSQRFGVSILGEDQQDLSTTFATSGSERPASLYTPGSTGVPLVRNAIATLECRTTEVHEGGDHLIFVGQVQALDIAPDGASRQPLLYFRGKYALVRT